MAITAFANLKGGVGKSLISMGCAHAAAADGKRVLLIDADPQGNTSIQMTNGEISPDTPARASLADVLDRQSGVAIDDAITPSRRDGIDLLPCGFDALQVVQNALFGKPGAENSLSRVLRPIADRWDAVFIDTRPATDLLTINALMAADNMVMILEPEIGAVRGGHQTQRAIDELEKYLDKGLVTAGVVINRVDIRRNDHLEMLAQIRRMTEEEEVTILGEPIPLMADLSQLVGDQLGDMRRVSPIQCYPLGAHHASRYALPRLALLGDAAHGVHPIHAQGFNMGIGDVDVLVAELAAAFLLAPTPNEGPRANPAQPVRGDHHGPPSRPEVAPPPSPM